MLALYEPIGALYFQGSTSTGYSGRWPPISVGPGRNPPNPPGSPRPGFGEGSGTSEPTCSAPPVFPNLVAPGRVIRYWAHAAIRSAIASGASMCRK